MMSEADQKFMKDQFDEIMRLECSEAELLDRVYLLESCLEEIEQVALVSEGVEFYAMLARKALDDEYVPPDLRDE
jgi:hypothetical protein